MKIYFNYLFVFALLVLLPGCEDFLDEKPDKSLVVPTDLKDFQALLDNDRQMLNQDLGLGFIGADNYYIQDNAWASLGTDIERNGYIWAKDIFAGEEPYDWNIPYEQVFYANVVLDGLNAVPVTEGNREERERLRGSALFFRAYAFYNLLQLFAAPYAPQAGGQGLGIPLRLTSDINAPGARAGLRESYEEVTGSLKEAVSLLPVSDDYKTRPDKTAAYGFLARVYLSMQEYELAESYADSCLGLYSTLMDYGAFDPAAAKPFSQYNEEVVFHSVMISYGIRDRALVVPDLYASYADDDLRKALFFQENEDGSISFKGRYSDRALFSGIATDEVYLVRAECRARLGDVPGAMKDLNTLLETRWRDGTFEAFTAANAGEALEIILRERRKELLFRGLRWTDLRRLNQDPRFAKTLERSLDGKTYKLPPNDPRYVYPIPEQEIDVSGIAQNPR